MDIQELQQRTLRSQIRLKIEAEEAARRRREQELDIARTGAQKIIDRTPLMIEEKIQRGEFCIETWNTYHGKTYTEDKKTFPIKGQHDVSDFLIEWAEKENFRVYIYRYCGNTNFLTLSWSPEDYA
jgi:hypothetical protein